MLIIAHSFLERRSLKIQLGPKLDLKEIAATLLSKLALF